MWVSPTLGHANQLLLRSPGPRGPTPTVIACPKTAPTHRLVRREGICPLSWGDHPRAPYWFFAMIASPRGTYMKTVEYLEQAFPSADEIGTGPE